MKKIIDYLLPVLERAEEGSEFKIISYRFGHNLWDEKSEFYKKITELLENETADFILLGGMPLKEPYIANLENLYKRGAKISILKKPPTQHHFIYNSPKYNDFIYVEEKHKSDAAKGRFFNYNPDNFNIIIANDKFDKLWEKGRPYEMVRIQE
ncbi:MAG: hypothetical protein KAT28_01025 [Candidatus Aenigmarchaeota archaeon]|nr:hypothetical protein [Candidatus Aenigmarchaeota archaeon]